jgi:hypothetical protein
VSAGRALRVVAIVIAVALFAVATAVFVSAAVDEPSKVLQRKVIVRAPERVVWAVLTDLDAYPGWNPMIVRASGRLVQGASLDLRVRDQDGSPEKRTVELLAVNPRHKLRWQDRLLLPGVRDRELTIRLRWLGPHRTLVDVAERYEGLLAPVADTDGEEIGLDRMVIALKERAERS